MSDRSVHNDIPLIFEGDYLGELVPKYGTRFFAPLRCAQNDMIMFYNGGGAKKALNRKERKGGAKTQNAVF